MFKGAAVKVFQHTPLPFYVILCNCEVDLGQGRDRVFPFLENEYLPGLGQSSDKERKMECSQLRFIAKRL